MRPGQVFMAPPDGSAPQWVDARDVLHFKSKGAKIVDVRMRMPNGMERTLNGVSAGRLRDAGGEIVPPGQEQKGTSFGQEVLGNLQRATAAIPGEVAQMASMMVPGGALARLGTAFGAGTAADMASKGIMGEAQDPMGSAVMGGLNAAWQAPFEGAAAVIPKLPRSFMKGALGNSLPGIEDLALRKGQVVSNEGLAARQKSVNRNVQSANDLIANAGNKYTWASFGRAMRGLIGRAQKGDILSRTAETALSEAQDVLKSKIGPQTTTTPASTILAPGRGNLRAGAPATPAVTTTTPAKHLSAQDVDEVRIWADNQAKGLRKAREAEGEKKVGAMEDAYLKVSQTATKILRATIPGLKEARLAARDDIQLRKATFGALKRAGEKPTSPMAAVMNLGQSPEGLSRAALAIHRRPQIPTVVRNAPRLLGIAAADQLSR